MRVLIAVLLALACTAAARAEDRALVIGINKYPGITLDGEPNRRNLNGAVFDAKSFSAFLVEKYGFGKNQVRVLIDGAASKSAIIESFNSWLVDGTRAGDRAVFFFAGHGAQTRDENGDEPDGDRFDEALAPADAKGELSRAPVRLANLLLDDELGELVKKLAGRHLMVVVDACHSGTITRGLERLPDERPELRTRSLTPRSPAVATRGVLDVSDPIRRAHKVNTRLIDVEPAAASGNEARTAVWTATASAQLALDEREGGFFTQTFLKGLVEKAADSTGDGSVLASELLNYVREKSEAKCARHPIVCSAGLTPTLEASKAYRDLVVFPIAADPEEAEPDVEQQAQAEFSHTNDFELGVEILPTLRPRFGSEVRFRVTTSEPGFLLLLDKGPSGKFTQIFPNEFARSYGKDGRLRGGKPLTLPDKTYGFAFEATEKGKSTLIALVVEDAARVGDVLRKHLDMDTLRDPAALILALARRLHRPLETRKDDEPNRRLKWAYATKSYVVE